MRQIFLIACWLLMAVSSQAATTLYFHNTASPIGRVVELSPPGGCIQNSHDWTYKQLNITSPPTLQAQTTYTHTPTSTAPSSNSYFPTQTTSGGQYLVFLSGPISAAITIGTGSVSISLCCAESATALNAFAGVEIRRWDGTTVSGTGLRELIVNMDADSAECPTTMNARTKTQTPVNGIDFKIGDRIAAFLKIRPNGTFGGDSSRTLTFGIDGDPVTVCDSHITFTENISFSTDINNAGTQVQVP